MTVLDVLIKARARIDKPQKWCAYWSVSDDERRLGADGAVWDFAGWGTKLARDVFHILAQYSGINDMWKDMDRVTYLTTHKEVMAMFDAAIAALEMPNA